MLTYGARRGKKSKTWGSSHGEATALWWTCSSLSGPPQVPFSTSPAPSGPHRANPVPWGIFGHFWRHVTGGVLLASSRGEGCCSTSYKARNSPAQQGPRSELSLQAAHGFLMHTGRRLLCIPIKGGSFSKGQNSECQKRPTSSPSRAVVLNFPNAATL